MRAVLAVVVVAGCYAPQPHPGAPCPDGICPTGLVCSPATMTCETAAIDARGGDTSLVIDAHVSDATGDARLDGSTTANAPVMRQQKTSFLAPNTSLSMTLNAAPVAGNVLIFVGATISGAVTISGGGVTTWTLATQSLSNANEEIYYGITDGTNAPITISRVDTATDIWMHVSEWSGLATSSLFESASSDAGLSSPASAGNITTTAPALLVFGATDFLPNTFGTPTPGTWTALTPIVAAQVTQSVWYRLEPTPGTYNPQVTETGHEWEAAHAAFHYVP